MDDELWTVDVTDGDIRAARAAWEAARDRGADDRRVTQLRDSFWGLVSTQAQQLAEQFRAERGRR